MTALLVLSIVHAQDNSRKTTIKNFGSVNANYFRGAQPDGRDYTDLAAMGVKTVLDLQRRGDESEGQFVEAAGMKFFRIRMSDSDSPTMEQAEEFLKIVTDPANHPVFVHCKGGRHRTGAMTAIYRITQNGWSAHQAYQEMKQFDFSYGFGHGDLKDFVFTFYDQYQNGEVTAAAASATSTR
jgi:protein tyrosine/serine phosphatase